jgi:hypothetical protein
MLFEDKIVKMESVSYQRERKDIFPIFQSNPKDGSITILLQSMLNKKPIHQLEANF